VLALAFSLGAEHVVNSRSVDAAASVQALIGGAHAALVTATAPAAFEQAVGMPGGESDLIRTSVASLIYGEL
jgi:alcohol dehydrogenase, propanol-preferring